MYRIKKIVFVLFLSTVIFAQDSSKYSVEDYFMSTKIGSPIFSPNGKNILFSLGEKEKWDGATDYNLWLQNVETNKQTQLTFSDKSEWNYKWSPDGNNIAFLSNRNKSVQVYLMPIDGGEARQITNVKNGIDNYSFAGNDKIIYQVTEERDSSIVANEKSAGGGWVVGTKFTKSSLWQKSLISSETKQITDGRKYILDFNVSETGNIIALITSEDSELYKQMTEPELEVINLAGKTLASFSGISGLSMPRISPDENYVATVGNTIGFSANDGLFLTHINSGRTVNVTYKFDPTIESIKWLNDETISFKTPRNVESGIYSVSLDDVSIGDAAMGGYINAEVSEIKTLYSPHWVIFGYDILKDKIVFNGNRGNIPTAVYYSDIDCDPVNAKKLTTNNDWITKKDLAHTEIINFKSKDNSDIEAVLTIPSEFNQDEPMPILVLPHGGPDGIIKNNFGVLSQILASYGFIVYEPNFRGSIGYGRDFYEANRGKLGHIDYDDIMAGLDYLISVGIADKEKMVVGGWSYGGYMTDWIIGHTDRFKAAVSVAGISNTVSMYSQSDINHGVIAEWEFKSVPTKSIQNFWNSSPVNFLKNCTTPTLILHGEADDRVPVMQGWELYRNLKDVGVETEMVLYPGAHHGIRPPKQFKNVMTRWGQWYLKHLK